MHGALPPRVTEPNLIAFCDESLRCRADGAGIYILAAVLLPSHRVQPTRDAMATLLLKGQRKLHWRDESARRRRLLTRQTASVEPEIVIATWCRMDSAHQERARSKAMQSLLAALADRGVTQTVFESRGTARDNGDLRGLTGLRRAGVLSADLRVEHAAGPAEHALWAADVAAGAFGAALDGSPEYWTAMVTGAKATVLTCGRCALSHGPDAARSTS
ncbi:hypothetical protein GCM10009730_40610 [Streptomyces albidochromogenes]|uniref:hypothetical protein n=1 Tax=Streptomyces albidochromogenes TaxID=329524 RepID=UPI00110FE61D|nr:hypothetical protein [Streptomyces albidochromogenes]